MLELQITQTRHHREKVQDPQKMIKIMKCGQQP